jgi:hypothetical protein
MIERGLQEAALLLFTCFSIIFSSLCNIMELRSVIPANTLPTHPKFPA